MRGLLLTMTEPRPEDEAEFNAWYDSEHLPERRGIPGFFSARRWIAVDAQPGSGKYLGTYALARPEVLDSAPYLAHYGDGQLPWSKRNLGRCTVFRRWACEQILPGDAPPAPEAAGVFLACGDVPAAHEDEFNRWYDEEHVPLLTKVPGVLGARRFRARSGAPLYIALYDLADLAAPQQPEWRVALATPWSKRIDAFTQDVEWILRTYRACP